MDFYAFVEGPLLWVAFLIFIIGTLARAALFLFTSYKMDKIIYQHFSLKYILSSLVRWLLPLNKSVPKNPSSIFALSFFPYGFTSTLFIGSCLASNGPGLQFQPSWPTG